MSGKRRAASGMASDFRAGALDIFRAALSETTRREPATYALFSRSAVQALAMISMFTPIKTQETMTSKEAPWAPQRVRGVRAAHAAHIYDEESRSMAVERRLAFGHGEAAAAFQPVLGTSPGGLSPVARVPQGEMALRAAPYAPAPATRTVAHFAYTGDRASCAIARELKF